MKSGSDIRNRWYGDQYIYLPLGYTINDGSKVIGVPRYTEGIITQIRFLGPIILVYR